MRSHKGILEAIDMSKKLYNKADKKDSDFKLPPAKKNS